MKFVAGLVCHLCGKRYPAEASWVCECLGPLEGLDYAAIRNASAAAHEYPEVALAPPRAAA